MTQPVIQGDNKTLQLLRMVSLLAAFLYIVFGFFMKHVLGLDDLIPLSHRVVFAVLFGGLAGLSYIYSLVRKHMALLTYALGCAAILNVLAMGTQGEFDAGSVVALLLVIPIMNFLFYRWKFLLYANALLFSVIVGVFTLSSPTLIETLLFFMSSATISGVSFWFTRRLLSTEVKSATNEQMFQDLFRHSMEGIAIHELVVDDSGEPIDYVFLEVNPTFEEYTGLKSDEILGKRVTEVLPGIEKTPFIGKYGHVVLTGEPVQFEQFSEPLQRYYRVSAYPMGGNRFATAFEDITKVKQAQVDLQERSEFVEGLIRAIPDAVVYVFDTAARQNVYASKGLEALLGYTVEEFQALGDRVLEELIHSDDLGPFMEHLQLVQTSAGDEVRVFDYRMRHRSGHWVWIENRDAVYSRDKSGVVTQTIGTAVDISERKEMETALRESENRFRAAVRGTGAGIWDWDMVADSVTFSKQWRTMLGYEEHEISNSFSGWQQLWHPDDAEMIKQAVEDHLLGKTGTYEVIHRLRHKSGDWRWIMTRGELQRDNDGKPLRWIGTNIDVTEQKQAEEELRIKSYVLDQIQDRVTVTDLNGVIQYVNQAEIAELGYSREEVVGSSIQIYGDSLRQGTTQTDVLQTTLEDGSWRGEIVNKTKDGECIVLDLKTQIIKDEAGNRIALAGISRDISEQKKVLQEIEYLSFHDILTGLYNRRFYEEELRRLDVPRNYPLAIMVIDVNGLKLTNDAFGHTRGDNLLKAVADVLRNTFRQDDIIARIGGDEFAILLPNTDEEQAHRLKQRAVCGVSGETVEGLPLSVVCGWAVKTDSNDDMHEVFKEAEDHMYRDKAAERNSYRYKTIQLIVQTIHAKSPRERQHAERVSQLCSDIGVAMGLNQAEIDHLIVAGELHDIGKITISNELLDRTRTLNDSEWEQIKRHPLTGYSILGTVNEYGLLADSVLAHHERWDGKGYPNGLKGAHIPRMARVITIADAYDAMTSDRPYRKGMSHEDAMAEIRRCSGSQFDPEVVKVFLEMMNNREAVGVREA